MCHSGSMARPPKPLDDARRSALFAAAAEVFARDGYQQTSLNRIIEAAGWGKSSFYHYFPNKLALHDAVVDDLCCQMAEQLRIPQIPPLDRESYWDAASQLLESLAAANVSNPHFTYLGQMFHRAATDEVPSGRLSLLRSDVQQWLSDLVERGQAVGALRGDMPTVLLCQLVIATLTCIDQWVLEHGVGALVAGGEAGEEGDVSVAAHEVLGLMRRQLAAPPE